MRALQRSLLAAREEGWVTEVAHQEGERVEAGAVIARLHDARAQLDVHRAEAVLASAKARVAQHQADAEKMNRDLNRIEELVSKGAGNERERDNARTDMNMTQARLDEALADQADAEAALGLAKQRLEDMTVKAPFAGVVVAKRTEVGQWLMRGDPIVEIVAMDRMVVRLDVPERYIDQLRDTKRPVQVRVPALGTTFEAAVTSIVPDADRMSRLFPVRAEMDNPEHRLRPGLSVVGLVPTGTTEPTLTISKDAVRRDDAGEFVFFVEGGVAAVARVETLFAVGDRLAVRSSRLTDGAQVVVRGNERLQPGMPVAVEGAPPPPAAAPAGGHH
jgi:RND family efflux transporter MFP subunit